MGKIVDYSGKHFNKITVIKKNGKKMTNRGNLVPSYLCQCDCGNFIELTRHQVCTECTKDCGCVEKNRIKNKYEFKENYVIGYDSKGKTFKIDLEDYEKVKTFRWYVQKKTGVVMSVKKSGEFTLIHRLVMGLNKEKVEVDHINHDRTDNRKENLRIVSHLDNMKNIPNNYKSNTTGKVGVIYRKKTNNYQARIKVNGKHINGGYFKTFEEAVKRRIELEEKYFGEFRNKGE